jgi:hypothetical protein
MCESKFQLPLLILHSSGTADVPCECGVTMFEDKSACVCARADAFICIVVVTSLLMILSTKNERIVKE